MSNPEEKKEVQPCGIPEEKTKKNDKEAPSSDNPLELLRQIAGEDAIITVEESESLGLSKEIRTPPHSPVKQFAPGELELFHSEDWPFDPKNRPLPPKNKLN